MAYQKLLQEEKIAENLLKEYMEMETIFREIPVDTDTDTDTEINITEQNRECILENLTPEELKNLEELIEKLSKEELSKGGAV
jgi:hypothetical protein